MDDQLSEAIVASFQDTVKNGINLEITVHNVADYQGAKDRCLFKTLREFVSIYE